MTNYKLTFYAGIGEDKDGQPIHGLQDKLEDVRCYLASVFGGYTEQAASGGWFNESGRLVKEPSVVFSAVTPHNISAFAAARHIAKALNQSAVLYTEEPVYQAVFVTQDEEASA